MPRFAFEGANVTPQGWRRCLHDVLVKRPAYGDVYQFGVAGGYSMQQLGYLIKKIYPNFAPTFYGFDVFSGMPVERIEPDKQVDRPGGFKLVETYGVPYLNTAVQMLERDVRHNLPDKSRLVIVQGLVEQTFDEQLKNQHKMKPAFYVDMDMDIYSPTRYALDFMFKHKLIILGSVIGFDDWGQNYPKFPIFSCGESRALREVTEKYNAAYSVVYKSPDNGQLAIQITKI